MLNRLREIMIEMNKVAKMNLMNNPELAKTVIIGTPEKVFTVLLEWTEERSQEKNLRQVVNSFVNKNCEYCILIGEAAVGIMKNGNLTHPFGMKILI